MKIRSVDFEFIAFRQTDRQTDRRGGGTLLYIYRCIINFTEKNKHDNYQLMYLYFAGKTMV